MSDIRNGNHTGSRWYLLTMGAGALIAGWAPLVAQARAPVTVHPRSRSARAPVGPSGAAVARAARVAQAPVIDGSDDDPAWRTVPPMSAFREAEPREGGDPNARTEFRVVYDDHNLYVFVRARDAHPDSIMHALTRRDVRGASDQIGLGIDSNDDHRTGYEFWVNPDGVKRDYAIYDDINEDVSWDAIWDVAARVDSLGWTAEFRIPFSQLRFRDAPTHTFGLLVWRTIERTKESVTWPLLRESRAGLASQFGELVGITGIAAVHELEVAPYIVAKNASRQTADGFDRAESQTVGGDLKYGVTSDLTLDATVNPDFGQVEADPSMVNLTSFETFLTEKRPFFLEGAGLYEFDLNCNYVNCYNEGVFYSRRIGRSPQLLDAFGDANSPAATPIAAAAKLTGRLPGGLSVGVLDAATQRVAGTGRRTIEPGTNYAVLRAQQHLARGATDVGVIATAVDRALDPWTRDSLRRSAYVGGGDFHTYFGSGQYKLSGSFTASRVSGTPAAITATERDAVHNFQRPGGALRVDSTRTVLTGTAEEVLVGKYGGGITRFQTSYQRQSAGYEPNDLGYLQRADEQSWSTWAGLNLRRPRWFYRSWTLNANQWNTWTTAGLRLENAVNANTHITLLNNWLVEGGATLDELGASVCDRCARGGPAVRVSRRFSPWFQLTGDERRTVVPAVSVNLTEGDAGRSRLLTVSPSLGLHLLSQLQTTVGMSISRNHDNTQWYGNFTDSAGATHYAFAHLDQRTVALTLQASYAVRPDLTVEMYAEPFVSSGTYSNIRQLSATPGAAAYDARFAPFIVPSGSPTGFDVRQLNSNVVVRWEYRPGSTIFFVWTHARTGSDDANPDRSLGAEYRNLFALHPNNTFLIKAAYTISP